MTTKNIKDLVPKQKTGKRGRPAGRKNNLTLLKDAEMKQALKFATSHMVEHLPKLIQTLVDRAQDGDMHAMKMVLDRVIPTRKAVEHVGQIERPTIQINVSTGAGSTPPFGEVIDAEVEDGNGE